MLHKKITRGIKTSSMTIISHEMLKDMSRFQVVLCPVELSPREDQARLKRLCRLIFPHLINE